MIVLDNKHKVEAEFINWRYDVDGTRMGAGVVICYDRDDGSGTPLYVTWMVIPSRDNHDIWWAETGHYGQLWKEAIADAMKRFDQVSGQFFIREDS